VLGCVPPAAGADWQVPLSVQRPTALPAPGFPVSVGIPLPRGRLREPGRVAVRIGARSTLPAQARPLEHWPDGSVRWLLVDFLLPPGSAGTSSAALVPLTVPDTAPPMAIDDTAAGRTVHAGPLRAVIGPDASLRLPSSGGAAAVVVGAAALTLAGRPPERPLPGTLTVETSGSVRTEVLVAGRYGSGVEYEVRLAFFAGLPLVRVRHTLINRSVRPTAEIVSLLTPVSLPARGGALGVDGRIVQVPRLEARARVVHQRDAETLAGSEKGRRADGVARASGELLTATVVVPAFWEQYPKRLDLSAAGIGLDLWAGGEQPVGLGLGAAKTHEYWLVVQRTDQAAAPGAVRATIAAPPLVMPDPRWTARSGALSGALHAGAPGASDFLERLARDVRRYEARARFERWDDGPPGPCGARTAQRVHTGFYGLLHLGDWNFPGFHDELEECDAWGNLEYDLAQVLGLAAASTARPELFRAFDRAAVHYRGVDIIHADAAHPDRVGLNHPHKVGHFDHRAKGNVDLGHAWLEGLLTHHRLTGQQRSRDAAVRMGDALAGRLGKARNPRQFGWPMVALAAVATSTASQRHRTAALDFARAGMARFPPESDGTDWKIGVLAEGLMSVHALTGDAAVEAWLRRYGETLLGAPAAAVAERDPRPGVVLGYLAVLTGDARYRRAALAQAAATEIGTWGKPIAVRGRVGFRLLAPLGGDGGPS
jgi:hypothetical protein